MTELSGGMRGAFHPSHARSPKFQELTQKSQRSQTFSRPDVTSRDFNPVLTRKLRVGARGMAETLRLLRLLRKFLMVAGEYRILCSAKSPPHETGSVQRNRLAATPPFPIPT